MNSNQAQCRQAAGRTCEALEQRALAAAVGAHQAAALAGHELKGHLTADKAEGWRVWSISSISVAAVCMPPWQAGCRCITFWRRRRGMPITVY